MEPRALGRSSLRVSPLGFGTATFGGEGDYYRAWGATDVAGARRMVDRCLDAGVTMFDTANTYSRGRAEEILGEAIRGRRDRVVIASKSSFPMGDAPDEWGSSRAAITKACDESLRRLGTDRIDLYYMHGFDAHTPVEETLRALDDLVRAGKILTIGCSNFSGWHLMKSLATSDAHDLARYAAHQAYYSLAARDYEWELMPLAIDQGVSTVVWSPLSGGALSGRIRRGEPVPPTTRVGKVGLGRAGDRDRLYSIVAVLEEIAGEVERPVTQVALNWVLSRPTVASAIVGARDDAQLAQNLGALEWTLDAAQIERLDRASEVKPAYPYWHQRVFRTLNPPPVPTYRDDGWGS